MPRQKNNNLKILSRCCPTCWPVSTTRPWERFSWSVRKQIWKALVWFRDKMYWDGKLDYFLHRKKSWGWHEDNVWLYQVRHRERMYLYEIILIIFAHNALLSKYWVPLCNHSDYVFIQLYQIQFYQIRYRHVEYLYVNIWLCFNCTQFY